MNPSMQGQPKLKRFHFPGVRVFFVACWPSCKTADRTCGYSTGLGVEWVGSRTEAQVTDEELDLRHQTVQMERHVGLR